jgi:hypothetical protein
VFARVLLPASKDFDFIILPEALSSLYYAVRPLRFAWQKAPNLIRCAIGASTLREG